MYSVVTLSEAYWFHKMRGERGEGREWGGCVWMILMQPAVTCHRSADLSLSPSLFCLPSSLSPSIFFPFFFFYYILVLFCSFLMRKKKKKRKKESKRRAADVFVYSFDSSWRNAWHCPINWQTDQFEVKNYLFFCLDGGLIGERFIFLNSIIVKFHRGLLLEWHQWCWGVGIDCRSQSSIRDDRKRICRTKMVKNLRKEVADCSELWLCAALRLLCRHLLQLTLSISVVNRFKLNCSMEKKKERWFSWNSSCIYLHELRLIERR